MHSSPPTHDGAANSEPAFRPPDVLIVQDSDESARILEEILLQTQSARQITHLRTGGQACAYLCADEPFQDRERPDLVILDLGSPTQGGHHFLRWVKENSKFDNLPVIVVAAADDQSDMSRAYRTRANGYLAKPINSKRLNRTIRNLSFYWAART